jgi:large subunit ribosomal protein L13
MGKHRPTYTPHIDTGDYVIVTNVDKVVFTGNKWQQKTYQRYTGYPGGQREEVAWKLFQRHPERILELAIKRMMPKNKIGRHMLSKLKLYVGPNHPHQAQQPIPLEPRAGRPAAAGALWAPEPQPRTEQPKSKKSKKKVEAPAPGIASEPPVSSAVAEAVAPAPAEPEVSLPAPEAEASLPAPEPEASLPAPESQAAAEEPTNPNPQG